MHSAIRFAFGQSRSRDRGRPARGGEDAAASPQPRCMTPRRGQWRKRPARTDKRSPNIAQAEGNSGARARSSGGPAPIGARSPRKARGRTASGRVKHQTILLRRLRADANRPLYAGRAAGDPRGAVEPRPRKAFQVLADSAGKPPSEHFPFTPQRPGEAKPEFKRRLCPRRLGGGAPPRAGGAVY